MEATRDAKSLQEFDAIWSIRNWKTKGITVIYNDVQNTSVLNSTSTSSTFEDTNKSSEIPIHSISRNAVVYERNCKEAQDKGPIFKETKDKNQRNDAAGIQIHRKQSVGNMASLVDERQVYILLAQSIMQSLPDKSKEIRGVGMFQNGSFTGIVTAQFCATRNKDDRDILIRERVIAFVRQVRIRPPRFVCINLSSMSKRTECTCNSMVGVHGAVSDICAHAASREGKVAALLRKLFQSEKSFGKEVEVEDSLHNNPLYCILLEKPAHLKRMECQMLGIGSCGLLSILLEGHLYQLLRFKVNYFNAKCAEQPIVCPAFMSPPAY